VILSTWLILVFPLHPYGFASAVLALIVMVPPIGIATKNAILMIDSAP